MAELSTNETTEISNALNMLSLDAEADPVDIADSKVSPAPELLSTVELSAKDADADEPKDSESASSQPVKGRVFVGGISWRTTDHDLREYFGQFGTIKDCLVCKDQWTGKSRGFGFLSFESQQVAEMLISKTHTIGGRTVQVKTAVPKPKKAPHPESPRMPAQQYRTKLFVGGVHRSVTNKEFRAHFEASGKLADAFIMYNMQSKRSRGFGFVTFVNQESAHRCLREQHTIKGKTVELKVAIPREVIGSQQRVKRKMPGGRRYQQQQQQHQQEQHQYAKYNGAWPAELHSTAGTVAYGHLLPGVPLMTPPLSPAGSEAPALGVMAPPQTAPALGVMAPPQTVDPRTGVYGPWIPPVMGPVAGMGADMYSQDVFYGGMGPPYGMVGHPYGYGSYHIPMYNPYGDAPTATMYDPRAGFPMSPPTASGPPPNPANPATPVIFQKGDAPAAEECE